MPGEDDEMVANPVGPSGPLPGHGRRRGASHSRRVRRHRLAAGVLALVVVLTAVWGLRLWHLRGEVAAYRSYWSRVASQPARTNALRYVALGDSAAQGIGASNPQHAYVSLIAARLQATTGRPVKIINISRSGARVDDVLRDQVPQLAGLHPDFITVDVGGNDVRHYRAADWTSGAGALCAKVPAGRSIVAGCPGSCTATGRATQGRRAPCSSVTAGRTASPSPLLRPASSPTAG